MKCALQILSILMIFLSLPAKAELKFVDLPKNCYLKKAYPCQVRVTGGNLSIERDSQVLHLADQAALSFLAVDEIQFLTGGAWIEKARDLKVKISSVLRIQVSGEWFIRKEKDSNTLVRNLSGEARFLSERVFPNEALPVGFQNWYGLLDSTGSVSRGVIRPIEASDFLKDWVRVSGLSVAEIKHQMMSYKELWKDAPEIASRLYAEVATRRIAAVEEKERLRAEKAQALKQEQLKLRQMYRHRNGLEENPP